MNDVDVSPVLTEQVRHALARGLPVVALESSVITHGMPWPRNLECAQAAERAVREAGATPATVAMLKGRVRVGLQGRELERLARRGREAVKCSRRDLPFVVRAGNDGGTTVAATMAIAAKLGVRILATGGIGGVHPGPGGSLDISADLQELARSNAGVVSSGPKSILDIGRTLEYLETHGVPVVGYRTDELPAFFTRESGFAVAHRLDQPGDVAHALEIKWSLGLEGGMVIANPAPEDCALERASVTQLVADATNEAAEQGVTGKDLTPFLLERIEAATDGRSLEANIELLIDNARLAAEIACCLAADSAP